MILLSFIYFILSLSLFLIGFIFGIVILILILFFLAIKKKHDFHNSKKTNSSDCDNKNNTENNKLEEKTFNFGDSTQLRWMNRLLWRAYPLLLDRHYIKVQIMEVFEQIPKDIPQIKKLVLSQFKTGMTPPILDNASIHAIPKYDLNINEEDTSNQSRIKRSKSNTYIDNFQEPKYLQRPYSLYQKAQKTSSESAMHSSKLVSHSNSNFDVSTIAGYNLIPNNQNHVKIIEEKNSLPPGFSIIKKIVESNKNCSDYLKFCFHFEPDLEIGAQVELGIRLLGNMTVAAIFKLHSVSGHFIVTIPPKTGRLSIGILESTIINFDITAQLGMISFNSEEWKSIWTSLKNWIHYFLHKIVINIPLEEILQKMVEAERESEKENDNERERMLEIAKQRLKEREKNNQEKINQKVVSCKPTTVHISKEVVQNKAEVQKKVENGKKNQKQLITFKHSMTLWDYEF